MSPPNTAVPRARIPWHWGAPPPTPAPTATAAWGPAITRTALTRARAEAVMLWVVQLHRAPYSYDWIDNLGRRSPRRPDPGLRGIGVGDSLMYIFTITGRGKHHVEAEMTSPIPRAVFGQVRIRYDVRDLGPARVLQYTMWLPATKPLTRLRRYALAWADLPMARKQLLTLTTLARSAAPGQYDRPTPSKE